MNRRQILSAAALAPLFATSGFWAAAHAQGAATGKRHKLVIQVSDNDPAKWNLALNNARNVQDDLGAANVDMEIVAYGPGIGMLKMEAPVAARVSEAAKAGVKIIACENTMRAQKLTKDDMHASISYVTAGVTEIMKKQGEGWAYVRP
ncbi:MAG: DsrE family protein [Burkholderiaceae bacterium]|uniref:DsrE family protein n=1 Tax=Hydrogenophaga sp. TaxID=1904254 RepID=UPI00271D18F0|nr:DsrE family protein [Hydrogenophaga sp.]MDO8277891.1 DsrE family protein [Burkholderiaceae bacterium]MDO9031025.1 DsrE family protein [Hydrogenophaga sp.]MDP1968461.1 DsrE family protein [Burkholderiaceae bacterium]